MRYFVQLQGIQILRKSSRRLSAALQYVAWGRSCTLLASSPPMSPLGAGKAAGPEKFCLFFCNITSQEQLLPQSLKKRSDAGKWLAWMLAKAICQLYRTWNRVVGKISRPFKPINLLALAELYYCPEVLGAGTTRAHEWLILLQLEKSLIVRERKSILKN